MSPNRSPPRDDKLRVLDDSTRREICAILATPDPPRSERDLAVELAVRSLDIPPRAVADEQRRRQQIRLRHHQLPKLDEYGVITYNRSRHTVAITQPGLDALRVVADVPVASPA